MSRKKYSPHEVFCADCGKPFLQTRWTEKFCEECRVKHAQPGTGNTTAERVKRWRARNNPSGKCIICGNPVSGGMAMYCASCKKKVQSDAMKRSNSTTFRKKTCRLCGASFLTQRTNKLVCPSCESDSDAMDWYHARDAMMRGKRKMDAAAGRLISRGKRGPWTAETQST